MDGGDPAPAEPDPRRPGRDAPRRGRGDAVPERLGDHAGRPHADRRRDRRRPLHGVHDRRRRLADRPPRLGPGRPDRRRSRTLGETLGKLEFGPTAARSTPRATSGRPTRSAPAACASRRAARSSRRSPLPEGLDVFACMLGGDDGRTLLMCAAPDFLEAQPHRRPRCRPAHHGGRRPARRIAIAGRLEAVTVLSEERRLACGLRCRDRRLSMSYLRHISTRRLLALCAAVVAILAGSATAIALATGGSGPRRRPAARAGRARCARRPAGRRRDGADHLHQPADRRGQPAGQRSAALRGQGPPVGRRRRAAPRVAGLERRRPRRRRAGAAARRPAVGLETASNTVYRATLPRTTRRPRISRCPRSPHQACADPPDPRAALAGAQPSDVAGRPAYTVRVTAAPRRRPARRRPGRVGRRERRPAARRRVRQRRRRPGARAEGHQRHFGAVAATRPRDPAAGRRHRRRPQPRRRGRPRSDRGR